MVKQQQSLRKPSPRKPSPRKPSPPKPAQPPRSRRLPVIVVAAVVVVGLAIVAVVASSGGGPSSNGSSVSAGGAQLQQARPVSVSGAALPEFTGTTPSPSDPATGKVAPTLTGQTFDGQPVTVANDGTPKVVMFLAHWCPHCQKEVPVITKYLSGHPAPAGVALRAVATSTSADRPNYPPSAWLERESWPVTTMADDGAGTAGTAYGLTSFPYFVAVNPAGKVVARASGELSTAEFQSLLDAAAKG